MSDWFITPAIENAVIVLATVPVEHGVAEADEEADFTPVVDWPATVGLLQSVAESAAVTPYLFFDPPEAEDAAEELIAQLPAELGKTLAVAAQPFGRLSERINGCLRRIFSRNETRRAVAVLSGQAFANPVAIQFALEALQSRTMVVMGVDKNSRLTLFGTTAHRPGLLQGLSLAQNTEGGWSQGMSELLNRLRAEGIPHEILPQDLA
jgi:hypothetical protein